MFAIIEIGGKQYGIREKEIIRVEKVDPSTAKVLLVATGTGTKIGTPYVAGAKVTLKVLKTEKADKVTAFKMKAKKRYKKTLGHRQIYNEVQVEKISV